MASPLSCLAGPIYMCDAEPGDVLGVEILDLQPRCAACCKGLASMQHLIRHLLLHPHMPGGSCSCSPSWQGFLSAMAAPCASSSCCNSSPTCAAGVKSWPPTLTVCRPNPGVGGRTFGSNSAGAWGFQYTTAGFLDGDKREVITIYEVRLRAEGTSEQHLCSLWCCAWPNVAICMPWLRAQQDSECAPCATLCMAWLHHS